MIKTFLETTSINKTELKVKLTFAKYKKIYEYNIEIEHPVTRESIAEEISKQIMQANEKRGKKHNRGRMPGYNLVLDLLRKKDVRITMPENMTNKEDAFNQAGMMNKLEKPYQTKDGKWRIRKWRVGVNTSSQVIQETDNPSLKNAQELKEYAERLLGYPFSLVKTAHGFHLIGSFKYNNINDYLYSNCLLLKPDITRTEKSFEDYIKQIIDFDVRLRNLQNLPENNNHKTTFTEEIKKSGLYSGFGDFDILYTVLSIRYRKSTLRVSKKFESDKYELL